MSPHEPSSRLRKEKGSHAPSKILVPVDFSESSRTALEYAAVLAARLGAEVDVLHVWEPDDEHASKVEMLSDFMKSDAGHEMMDWLASFELGGHVVAHGRLAPGLRSDIPDAIMESVESGEYDLVVMATHGRRGLSLLLRSSIAQQVVRRATCPVVTVRAPDDEGPPPVANDLGSTAAWTWPD